MPIASDAEPSKKYNEVVERHNQLANQFTETQNKYHQAENARIELTKKYNALGLEHKRLREKADEELLGRMIEDILEPNTAPEPKVPDCVQKYHEMIRQALVDWGDEIIDKIIASLGSTPKLVAQLEDIRKELVDPMRSF